MRYRFYWWFVVFALFFLFYPGDSYYFHIFAYNRGAFVPQKQQTLPDIHPIPYLKWASSPDITAGGAYIVDLPSFTRLYERNAHERMFPASTTKIITALVALDLYKPEQVITVKNASVEGQIMYLVEGEQMTLENLLYGLLVHSANDAAYAIANNAGYDRFIDLMNKKAHELHMKDSHFTNPAGLDNSDQYVTPFDLCLAGRALLTHPYLAKMVSTKEITISDINYQYFHKLTNVNKLLGEIQGLGGLKTGYTENAGENLVSYYRKNGHEYLVVLLKSEDRFADTRNVLKWIEETIDYKTVSLPTESNSP